MDLLISPYEGIGPIKLGMTRNEVINAVGSEPKPFMKTPSSELPTDNFIGKGIHVYYRSPDICKAIELHPPSNPIFQGYALINIPFIRALNHFEREDSSVKTDESGLTSPLFGINLFVPNLDEGLESLIKAVIIFEKGYFQ